MSFEFADNITSIVLNAVMTLALAGLLLLLGYYVRKKIPALAKYCIPAPVIGGFIFMFVTFAGLVTGTFQVKFTNIFQDYFMLALRPSASERASSCSRRAACCSSSTGSAAASSPYSRTSSGSASARSSASKRPTRCSPPRYP